MTKGAVAEFSVFGQGMLEVLSIGKGDLKLVVGGEDPQDVEKAREVIEEMLRKGYSIFVETDKGLVRVKRFNAKRMTYVISEMPEEEPVASVAAPKEERPAPKRSAKGSGFREVPVAGSRATAVGRTAGG